MRGNVAWPGVAVKTAKGRKYHYWTRSTPWVRLPDPMKDPDGFMRKIAHLGRVEIAKAEGRAGTLADTIRLYRKNPAFTDRAQNTRDLYNIYLEQLMLAFPDAALAEITPQLVQQYIMDENADRRGAANIMLKMLHIIFKFAMRRRRGLSDPTVGIDPYETGEHEAWPDHILEAALKSEDDLFRRAVHLYLYTGQRTGDVCRMTWNVIAGGRISVTQEKTDAPLLIPIHPDLAAEMAKAPRTTLTILANKIGQPLKPQTFRAWVDAFAAKHGVTLVPHGLRKNAVIGLLEAECSTAEVSSITGQSLAMVEHYARGRNQARIANVAMGKWGALRPVGQTENGKTFPKSENRGGK